MMHKQKVKRMYINTKQNKNARTLISEKAFKVSCPKCGTDLEGLLIQKLSIVTGFPEKELENGGMKELLLITAVGKFVLERAKIEYKESFLTEKTTSHVMEVVSKLMKEPLEEKEIEKYENKMQQLQEKIEQLEDEKNEKEETNQDLTLELEKLKEKVSSTPALKGELAEVELLEDIEANFSEQGFENISKQGHGDVLWKNIATNIGKKWVCTGISATIDSKDKGKLNEEDIDKLARDMKFHNAPIGVIVVTKQDQLRKKEVPCAIYDNEAGYIVVCSREYLNHHIALKLIRDLVVRKMFETKNSEHSKKIDTESLGNVLRDILSVNEQARRIKSKANSIMQDSEDIENFISAKVKAALEFLESEDLASDSQALKFSEHAIGGDENAM
jgi:uncharacterized protein (UPF0212 family)/regulator of replication initiation timing